MPSQRRYVRYFVDALPTWRRCKELNLPHPEPPTLLIRQIVIRPVPNCGSGSCTPYVQIVAPIWPLGKNSEEHETILFSSSWSSEKLQTYSARRQTEVIFPVNQTISGDILLRCFHRHGTSKIAKDELLFRVSLHTTYLEKVASSGGVLRLARHELDNIDCTRFPGSFCLDVALALAVAGDSQSSSIKGILPRSPRAETCRSPRADTIFQSIQGDEDSDPTCNDFSNSPVQLDVLRKEGWLYKRGEYNIAFQKRWFRLQPTMNNDRQCYSLSYFRKATDQTPRGSIDLSEPFAVEMAGSLGGYSCCFTVASKANKARTYVLCADPHNDENEMASWMNILIQVNVRQLLAQADLQDDDINEASLCKSPQCWREKLCISSPVQIYSISKSKWFEGVVTSEDAEQVEVSFKVEGEVFAKKLARSAHELAPFGEEVWTTDVDGDMPTRLVSRDL
eukprot:CAMPEP_0169286118 /NCGR_PEP_ID=MMETSP1016-20121227/59112_1 /TAXON_ID=342587 /ORGANISM="Karlodinium micrum, Strain CCMP2283" /LENGTH=449 /DNA_ID=CAMNT_0009375773 /DNA_START=143 /DNA_END=1492 /DNA_ORIENTATION=+